MKDIKTICRDIHQNATEHGFYDDEHDIASIIALSFENSDTKNKLQTALADMAITQKIALIHSELSEALEAHRQRRYGDRYTLEELTEQCGFRTALFEKYVKDTVGDELADAIIRIFDLSSELHIDIEKHIHLKMKYNKTRPYKHNKAY